MSQLREDRMTCNGSQEFRERVTVANSLLYVRLGRDWTYRKGSSRAAHDTADAPQSIACMRVVERDKSGTRSARAAPV